MTSEERQREADMAEMDPSWIRQAKPRYKRIAGGRVWNLVRVHFTVTKRLADHSLIDEIRKRRNAWPTNPSRRTSQLRKIFADMARDLRAAARNRHED